MSTFFIIMKRPRATLDVDSHHRRRHHLLCIYFLLFVSSLADTSSASHSGNSNRIDKCCKNGDVLVLDDSNNATANLECKKLFRSYAAGGHELHDLRKDTPKGVPACDEPSHLAQILYEETNERLLNNHEACLELFFEEGGGNDSFPVIVYCDNSTHPGIESNLEASPGKPSLGLPKILNHRKCCPENEIYDIDKKFCANTIDGAGSSSSSDADFKFVFDRLTEEPLDFINVYIGPPKCKQQQQQQRAVLVDYKVDLTNIYYDGSGFSITIPSVSNSGKPENITIDVDNACLDYGSSAEAALSSYSFIVARVCVSQADYCAANPCIRKCCLENQINTDCTDPPDGVGFADFRTSLEYIVESSNSTFDTKRYGLLTGKPCNEMYDISDEDVWKLLGSGDIVYENLTYTMANFCMGYTYNQSYFTDGLHPFVCFPDDSSIENPNYTSRFKITGVLELISCVFLIATFFVYACIPKLQNLHGQTLMCHVASLFFAFACLSMTGIYTNFIMDRIDNELADALCKYFGYATVFFFHSTFFWLNVMCFDIWWTFGCIHRAESTETKRRRQRNRFLLYCVYAFGLPILLTSLAIGIIEYTDVFDFTFGRDRCWFGYQSATELIFFILPIGLTLVINIVFFSITSYRCSKVKTDLKRVMGNVKDPAMRKFHSDKTRLIMNVKLFIVMGIPWVLENLSTFLKIYKLMPYWLDEVFFVADVINSLQGLWIFILFVLKSKVYHELRKRFSTNRLHSNKSSNTLNVQNSSRLHPVRKTASSSTLTSNFLPSSTTT